MKSTTMALITSKRLYFAAVVILTYAVCVLSLKGCPNCGSTIVPYPFSTTPDCGDQSYKIRCNATFLFFDSLNNTYPITSISPSNQRLTIEPSPFLPNTCNTTDLLTSNGLQLNSSAPFNLTSSNTVFYLNCPNSILTSPLNCTPNSLCHVYINGTAQSGCVNTQVCCALQTGASVTRYKIGFNDAGCGAYMSFVNLDYSLPWSRWPPPGVELQWVLPREPTCGELGDCDSGSTCRPDPNSNDAINRCFCNSGLQWDSVVGLCTKVYQEPGGRDKHRIALITGSTTGFGVALLAALIGFLFYKRHQRIKKEQERLTREREEILNAGGGKSAKLFTGKEIKKATNQFSKDHLLGIGGFGEVYKGILEDGRVVAVKCAKLGNTKGTEQVLNEVRILCRVNHKSLVGLLGCCVELEQPLLVYEYIQNGDLLDHLRGKKQEFLSWLRRLSIAHETAEGLAYLHFASVPRIYHRDVKSSNILLDSKLNAKVSDFGLSRLVHADLSHISTCAQGTIGYLDPDYFINFQMTDKSDVYSFGVVLLELLTSQKVIDFNRAEDDVSLASYVQRLVEEDRIMDVIDPMLIREGVSNIVFHSMKTLGFLAVRCLNEHRHSRPSMKEIVEEIEYIISIATSKVNE